MIILNYLYGEDISKFSLQEFYEYLEYLKTIGLSLELISYFEKIASNSQNENPYELLDNLIPYIERSNHKVYKCIKRKAI